VKTLAGWPRLGLGLLLIALALRALAAWDPRRVEDHFSRSLYPALSRVLQCTTALLPFSLAELLLALGVAWLCWHVGRALFREPRALWRAWPAALLAAAALYLAFLLLWGLNYQRLPFAVVAGLDSREPQAEELAALSRELVGEANALRIGLPEDEVGVLRLPGGMAGAFSRAAEGFERAEAVHPGLHGGCSRPKPVLASVLLSWFGIAGIYVPFTGEVNVNATLPAAELPFAAAHEIAHQRGFAREDEANYIGALACRLHPDADFRYSGALVAGAHALGSLAALDPSLAVRIAGLRSPAVVRDRQALAAWEARYRSPLRAVSERVNDAYLRSQGQRGGVRSYGRMVELLVAERRARLAGTFPVELATGAGEGAGSRP
jgi:hypothetical protein